MAALNEKLDSWKNKLLDMSLRNRLLNYQETKRATLRFKSPDIFTLWNDFVINEHPLEFPLAEEEEEDKSFFLQETELSADGENDWKNESSFSSGRQIITDKSVEDQQRTLRNLRTRSKKFMEEQGINVLYLSFGFLQWTEAEHSNGFHNAPLILVPVRLKWESIMSPFVLELHEDEIVLNPTLLYKLETDFGCKLPDFDQDMPLEDYFKQVEEMVENFHWNVIREVSLGTLSFLKINMYQDLVTHKDAILENPIIQAIGGDPTEITHDLSDIDHFDFDHNMKPEEMFQVVDADASQQDAILCAKKGVSFVLQGPPGTGKSQTITNIIAECLADGKKVLFVSEKMAALDVVYKRLTAADLADFCLVLHSYKANKKETLNQLDSVLRLAGKKYSLSGEIYQKLNQLEESRDELNEYAEEIYQVIEPLHMTIYDVNGILASVADYENIPFSIPDIRNTSADRYNEYISVLRRLSDMIELQKVDYHENPWRGANVSNVTYELRHDMQARISPLIDSIQDLIVSYDQVTRDFSLDIPDTHAGAEHLLRILNLAKEDVPFQSEWILRDDTASLLREVSECADLKSRFINARDALYSEMNTLQGNDDTFILEEEFPLSNAESLDSFISDFQQKVAQDSCYVIWEDEKIHEQLSLTRNAYQKMSEDYSALAEKISDVYEREIFDIPYNEIYFRFKEQSQSPVKFLNGQYRSDKKLIQSMLKGNQTKLDDSQIIEVLSDLRSLQEKKDWLDEHRGEMQELFPGYCDHEQIDFSAIDRHIAAFNTIEIAKKKITDLQQIMDENTCHEETLKEHYDQLYAGMDTDWDAVRGSLEWASAFTAEMGDLIPRNEAFITRLSEDQGCSEKCGEYAEILSRQLSEMNHDFSWFISHFEDQDLFENMRLPALIDRLSDCSDNLAALEEWIDYVNIRNECFDLGLEDYIQVLEQSNIPREHILPTFNKRFFSLWLDSVYPDFPAVANFRRKIQDNTVDDFRRLDKQQFEIATNRIRYKLIDNLPSMDHFTSGVDEVSILKRELGKQRKIMPIRKLFQKIPNLIMILKPCLMMSPLSVSLYLESSSFQFDTVIFDEASQVNTENAIGAIFRGKQVIIAGDSKQLPPTSFFASISGESDYDVDDDEDEDDSGAFESVLDEAALLPERTLLWHYRSRHEHLIAFSNAKIYHNNLITFPSSVDSAPDLGVEYTYVENGYYDRGGRKGNVIEAQKVAETVFEHFKTHPDRSLGVITFGDVQQQAIDTALRKMRQEDPSFEPFFNEEKEEPFFVKSLENVQGDERDTIIFSIGYGKDPYGVMRMNFGPLNKAGGERRLNVAITRAKYNVKLIGSILPTDIDVTRVSQEGPKLLRSYIEFAIDGPSALLQETTESDVIEHESPFEESVFRFLDEKGYKLATQVGCSGYRIDIAVKHPTLSGRYVLGIECDGATYHSARTARERDRLRQDVLENMGWKIYRIWSTDWIKDPVTEGDKLIQAIEEAINSYHGDYDLHFEEAKETTHLDDSELTGQKGQDRFLMEEYRFVPKGNSTNPYNFKPYPTNFPGTQKDEEFVSLTYTIRTIIRKAYPIHFDEICRLVAPLFNREKATSVVKKQVKVSLATLSEDFDEKEGFYFPRDVQILGLKIISPKLAGGRNIKYISILELASGMLTVAESCVGATRESLITETLRAFGFKRSGENIMAALSRAFDYLIENNYIEESNGKVAIKSSANQ